MTGVAALLLFFFFSHRAVAVEFAEISVLLKADVPELALAMIDRHQPDLKNQQQEWIKWEKQRFRLYDQLNAYDKLNERIAGLPSNLPADFYYWITRQGIDASLQRGEPEKARKLITRLLTEFEHKQGKKTLSELRRLLVTSYLLEGNAQDALKIANLHRKENGTLDRPWSVIYAKALVANNREAEAGKALEMLIGDDVMPLDLLVKLRLQQLTVDEVIHQANLKKGSFKKNDAAQIPYWAVIAEASRLKKDYKSQLWALEKVLSADARDYLSGSLLSANADSLWEAYRQYGMKLAADENMKVDSGDFISKSVELGKKELFYSRALYALAALESKKQATRIHAHLAFIKTLYLNRLGHRVVNRLYLDSSRYPHTQSVPDAIKHIMIDKALKNANIQLASRLLEGTKGLPADVDAINWRMQQARVHILAGNFQQGMQSLLALFKNVENLSNYQVDRLLQVLFDLQALGKHRTVYPLFETLMKRTRDLKRKREILYWMADSMRSLEQHEEASYLYLKSAGLIDANSMDLWAQSARYQAAESLSRAGLVNDAKQVLTGLLSITKETGRRALLKQQLQRLKTNGRL